MSRLAQTHPARKLNLLPNLGGKYKDFSKNFSNKPFYMLSEESGICVDKIIRFENLNEDVAETFSLLGIEEPGASLPNIKSGVRSKGRASAGEEREYRKYYEDERLLNLAKKEFKFYEDVFGYSF